MTRPSSRGAGRILLTVIPIAFAIPGFAQTSPNASLSVSDRAYMASRVYAALANFAYAQDHTPAEIDAAYRGYLDKALAAADRFAFSRETMEFLAGFHNSHTMLMDVELIRQGGSLPFNAAFSRGRWVVTASSVAALAPGDVIESIDGVPFEQFFADRRRWISASTDRFARRALFGRLPGMWLLAHLFPRQFVLGLAGGRQVTVDRRGSADPPPLAVEGRWLEEGREAYIRIPSFWGPEFEKRALELLNQFREAPFLIIDVRGNMGGGTPAQLTAALMDRPYRWWTESTPVILPYFRYRAGQGEWQYQPFDSPEFLWRSRAQQPSKDSFKGKLALLVDEGCHSACEDFVMGFRDNGRAMLFGATTAGSSGQPYVVDLGNGMQVLVASKREMFPDGSRFEGIGIQPDVETAPSIQEIREQRDAVLEMARRRFGSLTH